MSNAVRVMVERGRKKRSVACAFDWRRVLAWLGYVLSVAAARALIVCRFQQVPSDAVDVPAWYRRFVAGAAAAAAAGVGGAKFSDGGAAVAGCAPSWATAKLDCAHRLTTTSQLRLRIFPLAKP